MVQAGLGSGSSSGLREFLNDRKTFSDQIQTRSSPVLALTLKPDSSGLFSALNWTLTCLCLTSQAPGYLSQTLSKWKMQHFHFHFWSDLT